jgi:tetratricopeptide (TPR) repeat protein
MLRRVVTFTLAVVLTMSGCSRGPESIPRDGTSGTPVIIISIDTLRADHLPAYGYDKGQTPAIDALRRDSILFGNAYSHCPMTLPSHVSLLTGQLPFEHGVRNNLGYAVDTTKMLTLPAALKAKGYSTGAAVSAYVLRGSTGLGQVFEWYDDELAVRSNASVGELSRPGNVTVSRSTQWIDTQGDRPFFFMLHLFEPHAPYDPPEPFRSNVASAYDGEIATADSFVGTFIEHLKQRGIYDRALIILLSDHGEGLGDHGEDEHGVFVYREAIHVPLLIKLPKQTRAGERVDAPVQLVDIFPTVAGLTGAQLPTGANGISIVGEISPDRSIYSESLMPRLHFGWSELRSLVNRHHHFIEAPRPELYDFVADPRETKSVIEEQRRVYAAMRKTLEPMNAAVTAPGAISSEEAAKLAALGYVGTVREASGELPDPKDRIGDLTRMKEASQLERSGDINGALKTYRKLLDENPRFTDAWLRLAILHENRGELKPAIEAYKKAIESAPSLAPGFALSIGALQLRLRDFGAAEEHARLALSRSPGGAHLLLGRIALAKGDTSSAETEARAAMEDSIRRRDGAVLLARALAAKGRLNEALQTLDRVREEVRTSGLGPVQELERIRGDLLARAERFAEAETALREAIQQFPDDNEAYTTLAILFVTQGRVKEAEGVLELLVRRKPTKATAILAASTWDVVENPEAAARWRSLAQRLP